MAIIEYRLFFDNKPIKREQLDRIDEIVVEQEVDMMWEGRLKIPVIVDDLGHWTGEDDAFMKSFSRVRVEVKLGDNPFVPLIDGPVIRISNPMTFEPGKSYVNLIINDDSVLLNQKGRIRQFENLRDDEIAIQIFADHMSITSFEIEATTQKSPFPIVIQLGTDIQLLRTLSKRNGMHTYVLPGDVPGQSIGCFKSFPTKADCSSTTTTTLILLGSDHNLTNFNNTNDFTRPSKIKAFHLSMIDKSLSEYDASYDQADLMGTSPSLEDSQNASFEILSPFHKMSADPEQMVMAMARESSYSLEATGNILESCYQDVLQPYHVVRIFGTNGRHSGDYLISKVTHTLNRTSYSQSFAVRRNALSAGSNASQDNTGARLP